MKTLKGLAREIVAEHRAAERDAGKALEHARRAGELLALAKAKCSHGEWLPWLQKNCDMAPRTAQGYMRIASQWDELNARGAAHLQGGTWGALRLLAESDDEDADPEEEAELNRLHAKTLAVLKNPASTAEEQVEAVARVEQAESAAADRRHRQERADGERALFDRMAEVHAKLRKLAGQAVGMDTYCAVLRQLDDALEERRAAAA